MTRHRPQETPSPLIIDRRGRVRHRRYAHIDEPRPGGMTGQLSAGPAADAVDGGTADQGPGPGAPVCRPMPLSIAPRRPVPRSHFSSAT